MIPNPLELRLSEPAARFLCGCMGYMNQEKLLPNDEGRQAALETSALLEEIEASARKALEPVEVVEASPEHRLELTEEHARALYFASIFGAPDPTPALLDEARSRLRTYIGEEPPA